jgi:hypothetical protein
MNSTICEPATLSDSPRRNAVDIAWLKSQFTTERYYLDECDLGLGVFANRDIGKGEVILLIEGPPITFAETKRRGPRECMAIQVGLGSYIDTQPPGVFVNHSCAPNAGIKHNRYLVALQRIPKGEEIRYDYSTTMEEHSFTMKCRCGTARCRGVVRDFSTLPEGLQQWYLNQGIVMRFIRRCRMAQAQVAA